MENQAKYNASLPAERAIEYQVSGQTVKLTPGMVRQYLVTGKSEMVTDQEIVYFMHICRARGLNPFNKDCYLVKYSQDPAAIIVSIDKLRYQARKSADCVGWKSGVIVQKQGGELRYSNGLILDGEKLLGGWFDGKPKGWEEPFKLEVNLNGYIKKTRDGQTTQFWQQDKQPMMIAKVAEAQGLRRLWPEQMQGLFIQEEISVGLHDEPPIDITPTPSSGLQPPAWCDEILSNADESPLFDEFVAVTLQANRSTEYELRTSANSNPAAFLAAFKMWENRQQQAGAGEPQKPRKPRSDKGKPRQQVEPEQAPPADPTPTPEPAFSPPPPGHWSEDAELTAAKADLKSYQEEERFRYHILEAKRRTGIEQPQTLDGYNRLLEAIREVISEKAQK